MASYLPGSPPCFEGLTPKAILAEIEAILSTTSILHDQLAATLTPEVATFTNTILPIVDDKNRAICRLTILSELLSQLTPNQEVRQAAREAGKRKAAARAKSLMRRDVAALVQAVYVKETTAPPITLDEQDQHLLSFIHGEYIRSGALLSSDDDRERLQVASEELTEICIAAQDSFIEPEEGVWFERSELEGVPEALLATMIQDGPRVQVTFRKDHISAIMRYAVRGETRRRSTVANWHRLPENIKRLSKAVALRDEIARLLGFKHHAALKVEKRMASSVKHVQAQLKDLHQTLKPVAELETQRLLALKKKEITHSLTLVSELFEWDRSYYIHKQQKEGSGVDHALLAEYFEARHTLQGMLDLVCELFGMRFRPATISIWHESVLSYEVWNTESECGRFVGYLYVDLFAREGKYRGAHCISIQPGFVEANGTKHYPATALICSYAAPTESRRTLLQHSEVVTMFHELGHAIHCLVSRTKYALPSSRDYSEIPSNMLENWIWVPDILVRIGKHYTTLNPDYNDGSSGALPRPLAEAVVRSRNTNRANTILGQVWPAMFDLAIHTPATRAEAIYMDTTEVWNNTKRSVVTASAGEDPNDWGAGQARFVHMFRHNDAGYFSYPLSIAYAADIFASQFAKDPMNAVEGTRWRYQVLEAGASRPEMSILTDYLGREPSIKATLEELTPQ